VATLGGEMKIPFLACIRQSLADLTLQAALDANTERRLKVYSAN